MDPRTTAPRGGYNALRVLLAATAFALPLLAGEIALRAYHSILRERALANLPPEDERAIITSDDPELIYEFNPGWSRDGFRVNRLGLADDETTLAKPPGVFRVAVVGDSISANFMLAPREVSFPARLETRLQSLAPREGVDRFEVLNFGVNGYSAPQILQMARTRTREFDSDMIVAQLCLNDPFTSQIGYANTRSEYRVLLAGFLMRRLATERARAWAYVGSRYTTDGWDNIERNLRGLADLSRELPVLAVLVPYLGRGAYDDWGFEQIHERYAAVAREAGLDLVDLRDDFEQAGLLGVRLPADPIHPNADGHSLIADRTFEELLTRDMLDRRN